ATSSSVVSAPHERTPPHFASRVAVAGYQRRTRARRVRWPREQQHGAIGGRRRDRRAREGLSPKRASPLLRRGGHVRARALRLPPLLGPRLLRRVRVAGPPDGPLDRARRSLARTLVPRSRARRDGIARRRVRAAPNDLLDRLVGRRAPRRVLCGR